MHRHGSRACQSPSRRALSRPRRRVISDVWTSVPRKLPYKCRRSGLSDAADGPFFEDSLPFREDEGDDRELTHYTSVSWLKTMADAPGSPIVVIDRGEYQAMLDQLADVERERDEALERLENAQKPDVVVSPIDVKALVVELSEYLPKKPGPKPKAAA